MYISILTSIPFFSIFNYTFNGTNHITIHAYLLMLEANMCHQKSQTKKKITVELEKNYGWKELRRKHVVVRVLMDQKQRSGLFGSSK